MKKAKARAAVLEGPRKFSIQEFDVPRPGENDVLLEVEMCTICGSDLPVYKGLRPEVQFPVILGHELMLNAGRVLSREQLVERLYAWGEEIESNAIDVHVHHLRRKLAPEVIRTVRGVGYLLPRSKDV